MTFALSEKVQLKTNTLKNFNNREEEKYHLFYARIWSSYGQ